MALLYNELFLWSVIGGAYALGLFATVLLFVNSTLERFNWKDKILVTFFALIWPITILLLAIWGFVEWVANLSFRR